MNSHRLVALLLVLGALIGIQLLLRSRERSVLPPSQVIQLIPADVTLDTLSAVELSMGQPDTPQVLIVRNPKGWRVATAYGAAAELDHLRRFVEALKGLTGEERAHGRKWFGDFGVGEQSLHLVLRQEDRVVSSLVIGRSRKDPTLNFVRRSGDDVVYVVEKDLLAQAGLGGSASVLPEELSAQRWVNLKLFPVDADSLSDVELAERIRGNWVVRGECHKPFDQETLGWLKQVLGLQGWAILDPETSVLAFKGSRWRWMLKQQDGTVLAMEESQPKEKDEGVTVRFFPEGPYLTVTESSLQHFRERLLPQKK